MGVINRNDYSGLVQVPVIELTGEELASLRVILRDRIKGLPGYFGDLSDDAWADAVEREDKGALVREMDSFIESQGMVARFVRGMSAGRDNTGADDVIGFLAGGGLEKDCAAATVMLREYAALVRDWVPFPAGEIFDKMIAFYQRLGVALKAAGVEI
jgi:hypothetical protein